MQEAVLYAFRNTLASVTTEINNGPAEGAVIGFV
jgi:hypothetical protein